MVKDWLPHISIQKEWNSTWWDHFRHVYSFIECLHQAVVDHRNVVNYDERKRFDITADIYPEYAQHIGTMIFDIQQQLSQTIVVKSSVYPDLYALSTVKRELQILLEHDETHHAYFDESFHENEPLISTIALWNKIKDIVLWDNQNIIAHIEESISTYNIVAKSVNIPDRINNTFHELMASYITIAKFPIDYILVKNIDWDITSTSVSRELYYLEESLMHFLYELRIYLKDHHESYYHELIMKEPDFGIAHSTRQNILDQSL